MGRGSQIPIRSIAIETIATKVVLVLSLHHYKELSFFPLDLKTHGQDLDAYDHIHTSSTSSGHRLGLDIVLVLCTHHLVLRLDSSSSQCVKTMQYVVYSNGTETRCT